MDADELRADGTWVTPTRRLAHDLRVRFDAACAARGLAVWRSRDIATWDELIERMFALDRQAGRLAGRWLPANAAELVWQRIVRRDPAAGPLLSPAGVGRAAYQAWRRMHAHRIPVAALADEAGAEVTAFGRWADSYSAWLQEAGWMDPSLAPELVTIEACVPRLEFVGFDLLTPAQEAFLQRLASAGIDVRHSGTQPRRGETAWVACEDRGAELETAARWAALSLDGKPGKRLAIVVPDLARRRDEVRRVLTRVLVPGATLSGGPAPESVAFELAAARALARQPVVASALDALDAFAGTRDLVAAGRLLRSSFLRAADAEGDARARLDARIRRHEPPDLGLARLGQLAEERACPEFALALRAALRLVQEWPRAALPNRWVRIFVDLLATLGWPGAGLDSREHQARQRWGTLVAEFGACDDFVGAVGSSEAAGLLREMADNVLFEPEELRAPLLVIDAETCAGMSFDGLWVCGLDDARWPAAATPDPFLPRAWQVRQRVPGCTAGLADEDARRLLARLCSSADEVILSVPQFDDDAPLLASALLDGIPRRELPPLWPEESMAATTCARRPVLEVDVDGTMPPVASGETGRGGARLLELQAACPFRAQAEQRLGARALEETELGLDAAARGDLVHAVLARLWDELRDRERLRAMSTEATAATVRRVIDAELASAHRGAEGVRRHLLDIEAGWLESRVRELLEAERVRPDFAVDAVEQAITISIGGLTLDLRPDRIDRLEDGTLAVIDYKTGADAETRAWLDERPKLPQLPLYATALGANRVAAVAFARVRTGDTGYDGLASNPESFPGLKSPGAKGWPREFGSWGEMLERWRERLTALASEHVTGDARLAPDPKHACEYCHLEALCRIAETRAGRAGEDLNDD